MGRLFFPPKRLSYRLLPPILCVSRHLTITTHLSAALASNRVRLFSRIPLRAAPDVRGIIVQLLWRRFRGRNPGISPAARSFQKHHQPGGFLRSMPDDIDPRIEAEIKANGHHLSILREIQKRIKVRRPRGRKMLRFGNSPASTFPPSLSRG